VIERTAEGARNGGGSHTPCLRRTRRLRKRSKGRMSLSLRDG
jgi:hypothetical protein